MKQFRKDLISIALQVTMSAIMAVLMRCAAWSAGGLCVAASDPAGVFYPVSGGGGQAAFVRRYLSEENLDAEAIGMSKH